MCGVENDPGTMIMEKSVFAWVDAMLVIMDEFEWNSS